MKDNITIPKEAMEETSMILQTEWKNMSEKTMMRTSQIIREFIRLEFHSYFYFGSIAMIFIILLASCFDLKLKELYIVYHMILGMYSVYELCCNRFFQCEEIMSVSYMNLARSCLCRIVVIVSFQFLMFFIAAGIQVLLFQEDWLQMFLFTILPVQISLLIVLLFMEYIKNGITLLTLYTATYSVYQLIFFQNDKLIHLLAKNVVPFSIIVCVLFGMCTLHVYWKQKKRGFSLWN